MSFNRLAYDDCEYKKRLDESVNPLSYILNPIKYENCEKCRHELGLVSGPAVSHVEGDLVLLESELRGITRRASRCPSAQFQPSAGEVITLQGSACGAPQQLSTKMLHLPPCQMIRYAPIPLPSLPKNTYTCPQPQPPMPSPCPRPPAKGNCFF